MARWTNDQCDECGRTQPVLHGIGPSEMGDVLAFCCACCNAGKANGVKCTCNEVPCVRCETMTEQMPWLQPEDVYCRPCLEAMYTSLEDSDEPDWDGMAEDYWNEKMSDPNH